MVTGKRQCSIEAESPGFSDDNTERYINEQSSSGQNSLIFRLEGDSMKQHGGAGLNRTHDRLEDRERIDSFEIKYQYFLLKDLRRLYFILAGDSVYISEYETLLELTYIYNAAGRIFFFLCPSCGRRARFLYLPGFQCRECSKLNYRSQQVTHGSYDEVTGIPLHLDVKPPQNDLDAMGEYEIPRPRYLHKRRFERYKKRFEKHKARYIERELNISASLIGRMIGLIDDSEFIEAWQGFINDTL